MTMLRRPKKPVFGAILLLAAIAILLAAAGSAFAQATSGSVKGTVSDQAGAVIPGASVTAKNQDTGVVSPVFKSTSDGIYNIPTLIPGRYTITVEAPNFKKAVYTDVDVRIGQPTVIDITMQAGGASETVTVTANTETVIQKDTAQVSTDFQARQVEELPSNVAGSGIDTIALLTPGVTPGFGNVNGNGTTLSVNGNRARSNNFTIDGQDNNDLSIGGPSVFVDNQDMVADYQVITNNFSAQYGRNQGAIVNIVTKGGTNQFHGSLFEFHRDASLLDSLDNQEKLRGQTGPNPLLYNVYGGTVGGPIKKDRAFFFASYEGIQTRQIFTTQADGIVEAHRYAILPQDLQRLDQSFPGNPAIHALATQGAFALTGLGTVSVVPGTQDTINIGGKTFAIGEPQRSFESPQATPYNQNEFSGRADIKLTDKDSIWDRYLFQQNNFKNNLGSSSGFVGDIPARSQIEGFTWDRQVSSNALNDFSFSWTRLFVYFGGGCTTGAAGCIPTPTQTDQAFTNISFGGAVAGTQGVRLQTVGPATNLPQGRTVTAYQWRDNFSFTRGRHQFTAGADIRRLLNDDIFLPDVNGAFNYGSISRLVANDPSTVTVGIGNVDLKFGETDQFYYFQDDWKVRDNLTLNLGLRYEYTGQPINVLHDKSVATESNPATALWLQSLPLSARTVPKIPSDKNNFAPRIGFAYTPRFWKKVFGEDSTVIRGGYSIAYDPAFYNILVNVSTSSPFIFLLPISNPAVGSSSPIFGIPGTGFGPDVRAGVKSQGFVKTNTFDPRFFAQTQVAGNFRSPYAEQWSFGIQRQINKNNVFEARYLGTHGVGLFQNIVSNPYVAPFLNGFTTGGLGGAFAGGPTFNFPAFPNLVPAGIHAVVAGEGGCVNDPATPGNELTQCVGREFPQARTLARANSAQSIYHSLQLRYNGRIGNQLTVGAAYTFSKALDNASEVFAFQENSTAQDPFNVTNAERSYSGFDRRNQIALNFIWDVPAFKEQKGLLGHVAGGWQLNGIYVIDSGLRYTPTQLFGSVLSGQGFTSGGVPLFPSYTDPNGDNLKPFYGNPNAAPGTVGIFGYDVDLFDLVFWDINLAKVKPTQLYSFNTLANNGVLKPVSMSDVRFIENGPGAAKMFGTPFGNVARNSQIGPRINQFNLGVFKNTHISERINLQLRLEAFNVLNHPNPGYGYINAGLANIPDNLIEDAAGSTFQNVSAMEFARRAVQLGIRIVF